MFDKAYDGRKNIARELRRYQKNKWCVYLHRYYIGFDEEPIFYCEQQGKVVDMYNPDLNPLDFGLWRNIEKRMDDAAPTGRESVVAFKKRLRRTALATSTAQVQKTVEAMRARAQQIYDADGQDISRD